MPEIEPQATTPTKKSVQFSEAHVVHIVENWKQFNYTPKETKNVQKQSKIEKVVIRTDCEKFFIEKYEQFKTAVKELTTSCSFV